MEQLYHFRGAFQVESLNLTFPALNRQGQGAALVVGGKYPSGQLIAHPEGTGGGPAAGAAGQGKVLHPPLKGQHPHLPGLQHLVEVYVCPLGEGRVMAQCLHPGPEGLLVLPQIPGIGGNGVGNSGIAQLYIGNPRFPVQIQNPGIVQLHPYWLSLSRQPCTRPASVSTTISGPAMPRS